MIVEKLLNLLPFEWEAESFVSKSVDGLPVFLCGCFGFDEAVLDEDCCLACHSQSPFV